MTHRGPFQPRPFCDSVKYTNFYLKKMDFPPTLLSSKCNFCCWWVFLGACFCCVGFFLQYNNTYFSLFLDEISYTTV